MLEWIYRLLIGHSHKWKILKAVECTQPADDLVEGAKWTRYYCQCEICGKIKYFD